MYMYMYVYRHTLPGGRGLRRHSRSLTVPAEGGYFPGRCHGTSQTDVLTAAPMEYHLPLVQSCTGAVGLSLCPKRCVDFRGLSLKLCENKSHRSSFVSRGECKVIQSFEIFNGAWFPRIGPFGSPMPFPAS